MSILSGIKKVIPYFKNADGNYEQLSYKTSSQTVDFDDGKTAETKLGAIKGITTSTSVTETGYAADAKTVSEINQSLDIKNKVFLFSISEEKYYLEDFSKYKYISIETTNCGSKIFPVRLLNIMQITDEISRTTSSTYFIHAFFTVQNNKLAYHSCYTSGYDKQDLYVYGIL